MTTGWGIVGCGTAADAMSKAIAAAGDARVRAVHDVVESRANELARTYGASVCRSFDDVLAQPGLDAVYVALPHHLLAPTAERALAAGKHVLVEKPMALSVPTIRALQRNAEERGLVVAPVFELRGEPVFAEARRLVGAGAIGVVRNIRITTLIDKPSGYWGSAWRGRVAEAGGGVVLMNAIHQLDLVRFMTGLEVVSASAELDTLYADVEVEDTAAAVLRFSDRSIGSLVASAHSPGALGEERIAIDGSLGRIALPDPTGEGAHRLDLFLRRPTGEFTEERTRVAAAAPVDSYVAFVRAFLAAIEGDGQPLATADDAAAALATVQAVYRAARDGRRVAVELP